MAMVLESATVLRDPTIPGSVLRARLSLPRSTGGFRVAFPTVSRRSSEQSSFLHAQSSPRGIVCEQQQPEQGTLSPEEVTDKTWKEIVLQCDVPVLVDFWAPWCGPCRMIAPIVDELAKEYVGRVRCVKLNTDESPTTATEYGIRSIPTVMIFKGGEKKDTIIGAVPKATLVTTIEKLL